jgi:RNA polymerase sigma-70 factor, ECF subfamily
VKSDEQLVLCYRNAGDAEALDELVGRHLRKVLAMIFGMVLNRAAAEDLTQEVFLRAFRALSSFDGRSRFSTWLYRIAMNTTQGFLSRENHSPVVFRSELPGSLQPFDAQPDRVAMQSELDYAVETALGQLPPKLRAAIVLTAIEQFTPRKAALIEGCSIGTMYWRIHEARRLLKQRLERFFYHDQRA